MGIVTVIKATDIGDAWFQTLSEVMTKGRRYLVTKGSYEGIYRAGLSVLIEISHPWTRPLAPQIPGGLTTVPPPTTDEKINEYAPYVMTAIRQPGEHYSYGEDLEWQIEWVIRHFKDGGHGNNHCYMTVGRPETLHHYDLDVDYGEVVIVRDRLTKKIINRYKRSNLWNRDPANKPSSQCLRGIDCWIANDILYFWIYFRSWDHWGGFPQNLGGFQLMKEYMAMQIGVKDGPMVVTSKDLHVYEHTWMTALMRLGKEQQKKQEDEEGLKWQIV